MLLGVVGGGGGGDGWGRLVREWGGDSGGKSVWYSSPHSSSPYPPVQAAVVAAANLSLNVGNMKEMEQCVVVLVLLAENR